MTGHICQFASFPFLQCDVRIQGLVLHLINEVTQTVGMGVEVRGVDLEDVAGENDFGVFSSPGNHRFDLVGG